jgi:hypothetical protein
VGAAAATAHREEGEEEAMGGGGASGRGGARWCIWPWRRAPLPEESSPAPVVAGGGALFAGEEEKKEERNGERLTLSSLVENEASDFSPPSGRPSPSIVVLSMLLPK